ncbi:AMP-dependent synthetase [Williamsia sp. D3]|nr:AMP-dependent synthetase [Williamsia sp. D3]
MTMTEVETIPENNQRPAIFASPHADVVIPDLSLPGFLLGDLTDEDRGRIAVVDRSGPALTYGELQSTIRRTAARLSPAIKTGDVVALMGPNSADWVAAFLAAISIGAAVTTINVLATVGEVVKQLRDSRATLFVVAKSCEPVARAAATEMGMLGSDVRLLPDVVASPKSATPAVEPVRPIVVPTTQLAVLPYSSGTTGEAKGVMLTHRNLVANVCQLDGLLGVDEHSSVVALLPFSHIYGMTVVLHLALRRRAKIVIVPRFEVEDLLSTMERERATHLFVAPPVVVALVKSAAVERYDLSALRLLVSGAAPLDAGLAQTVAERLSCQVRQAYGMSEMSPVSHVAPLSGPSVEPSSVGFTVPNMTCKIVDPVNGEPVSMPHSGTSAAGELCCAGPNVMAGYLGNAEATAGAIDADGFLHTGDLATVDAAGAVTVVDRLKELIKYKGYQVAPAELEGLLLDHPDVADAAVVGVPFGEGGDEAPRAYVVRRPGSTVDEPRLIDYVASRVSPYKKVREVVFLDEIPKSPSGKILRRLLRDR